MEFVRRAVRAVFRRWVRSVLVVGVLCFVFALLVSIPPSIVASREATQETIDILTSNAVEVNATVGTVARQISCSLPKVSVPVSESNNETVMVQPLMNATRYINNITLISHVEEVFAVFDVDMNASGFVFEVCGLPLNNVSLFEMGSLLLPSNVTVGRSLEFNDVGVVVLQERVAEYFGVGVGEVVNILDKPFRVVGVEGYTALNRTVAYMGLSDVWLLTNNVGNVSSVRVFVDDVVNVEGVVGELSLVFPELSVSFSASLVYSFMQVQAQTGVQLELAQATMDQIERVGLMELGIVVAVACVITLFIMLYTVRERTHEIGTLKALGASDSSVLGQFVFEGVILCFVAGVFSLIIGTIGTSYFANLLLPAPTLAGNSTISSGGVFMSEASLGVVSVGLSFEVVLFGLGVAVLLGVIGSLYPAWRAARIRPAEAMRYN
ncbi:MAG: FtsX-like permease family protein [Candidatus Bathyarchaeota archaeon]|nr:FtsX-like permease family protein [Candidatus Termiticorpusculum sp.]